MRHARSKATFRPRWRKRTPGNIENKTSIIKPGTSSSGESIYQSQTLAWLSRVNSAGGTVDNSTINAVDAFVKELKASDSLIGKIKRLNLFCGEDLTTSLVPLIVNSNNPQDVNHNFINSDYSETGAKAGLRDNNSAGTKYLDTGGTLADLSLDFSSGHIAVNSLGTYTASSYQEWFGRGHASLGSSLSSNKHHFRWGEHLLEISNSNPQSGTSMGFYLGNCTSTEISIHLNGYKKASETFSSNAPTNSVVDQKFYVFNRDVSNTSWSAATQNFDRAINFYSVGTHLTDEEAKIVYTALNNFNQTLGRESFSAVDKEVWEWANHRIPEVVGDQDT